MFRVKADPAQGGVLRQGACQALGGSGVSGDPLTTWPAGAHDLKGLVPALLCWPSCVLSFIPTLALFLFFSKTAKACSTRWRFLQCSRLNL